MKVFIGKNGNIIKSILSSSSSSQKFVTYNIRNRRIDPLTSRLIFNRKFKSNSYLNNVLFWGSYITVGIINGSK
jgi:hypothetical protein